MNLFSRFILVLGFCGCIAAIQSAFANNAAYELRRTNYINNALTNVSPDAVTIQAYSNIPVDTGYLNGMINNVLTGTTSDFDIVKLVRILYFSNGQYDSIVLPALNSCPYWLRKDETRRTYWSENHMIMWMSSDWLLHEKYGRAIDSTLDKRLRHFLHLKIQYGYYEFFSSVYAPYCLTGLLNLADFSQDAEIKDLAGQAAQRLLRDMLMLTNDQGVYFPAAGRNYYGKYMSAWGQNHSNLIYLLTGMGPTPGFASHAGGFLATSTLSVDSIISSWVPNLDTVYSVGHSLDSGFVINSQQSHLDRIIFQWSSGAYFHPEVALESATLISDSNLWHHVDFIPFSSLSSVSLSSVPALSQQLSVASKSSLICGEDIVIYKHGSITLSSVRNFWKGKLGYQEFPCVANVGTTAVLTASGQVNIDWTDRKETNANEHLPYVLQRKNVALIMYRPEPKPDILGYHHPEVAYYWNHADYDEERSDSLWLLGRQGNNYVALRRTCLGEIDSVPACDIPNGQTWVLMVGDSGLYGSFSNFEAVVNQSQFTESWYYDSLGQSVYYAKIVMDTSTLDYAWAVDTNTTGINENYPQTQNVASLLYPNPTSGVVTIDVSAFLNQNITISTLNILGQEVYSEKMVVGSAQKSLNTSEWPEGVYMFKIEAPNQRWCGKLIKH